MAKSTLHSRLSGQVQWQHPKLNQKLSQSAIDQTQLVIADAPTEPVPFSFVVMGDTDAGQPTQAGLSAFSTAFAEQLTQHLGESRFLLHTGDVTYPIGSYQNYLNGFLRPYQSLLSNIPSSPSYRSESVVFKRPLLPVPGNHDYAEPDFRFWQMAIRVVCDRLRHLGIDLGNYGGQGGEAYGQTFLDDLKKLSPKQLTTHLATHYSAVIANTLSPDGIKSDLRYGLSYQPGEFTRLPNRYYRFRYGGVDFFALDSNTWNQDSAAEGFDHQQLSWLEQALIQSWQTPDTASRIIYLHHSPYTTEASRWQQPETLWVRQHLQAVLGRVAIELSKIGERTDSGDRADLPVRQHNSLVDLVISGHAHCLEHLRTTDTGHADAYTDWLVCGGSGADVRRQREAGGDILGRVFSQGKSHASVVAKSQLYAGLQGRNYKKKPFHSFLRIEVQPNQPQKLLVCPFVVSEESDGWQTKALKPIRVGRLHAEPFSVIREKAS